MTILARLWNDWIRSLRTLQAIQFAAPWRSRSGRPC